MIKTQKQQWGTAQLCQDSGLPIEFSEYMEKVRSISFEEKPDYTALRQIFKSLFYRLGHEYDYAFDWVEPPIKTESSNRTLKSPSV